MFTRFGCNCYHRPLRQSNWVFVQSLLSTHKATFQRINISKAKELFQTYSETMLPDYVNVTESSSGETFKLTISKFGTSEIEFQLKERQCQETGTDIVDVFETNRKIAFSHKIKAGELEKRIEEISHRVQKHIDAN